MEKTLLTFVVAIPLGSICFFFLDVTAHSLGVPLPFVLLTAWGVTGFLWFAVVTYKRRALRFGIKEAGLVIALIAASLAAWIRYVEPLRKEQRVLTLIESLNGRYKTEVSESPLLRKYFGDEYALHVTYARHLTQLTDDEVWVFRNLPRLSYLSLGDSKVTESGFQRLENLPELKFLCLSGLPISDAGLQRLSKFPSVEGLVLSGTEITDEGLENLVVVLPNLQSLNISRTAVTDQGLQTLLRFQQLKTVTLFECNAVTADGVKSLQRPGMKLGVDQEFHHLLHLSGGNRSRRHGRGGDDTGSPRPD